MPQEKRKQAMRRAKPCSKALNPAPAPSSVLAARGGLTRLEQGLWALSASGAVLTALRQLRASSRLVPCRWRSESKRCDELNPAQKALNLAPAPSSVLAARAGLTRLEQGLCVGDVRIRSSFWTKPLGSTPNRYTTSKNTSVGRPLSLTRNTSNINTALKHNTAIASHFSAKTPLSPHQRPNPLYGGCTQEPRVYLSAHIAPRLSEPTHPLTEIPHRPANPLSKTSLALPPPIQPTLKSRTHIHTQLQSDQCTPNEAVLCLLLCCCVIIIHPPPSHLPPLPSSFPSFPSSPSLSHTIHSFLSHHPISPS